MFGIFKPKTKTASDAKGDKDALVKAVLIWAGDTEGIPQNPADAKLHQALWRYEGDRLEPCPGCDGECEEACAPTTAKAACASLDRWIDDWRKRQSAHQLLKQ